VETIIDGCWPTRGIVGKCALKTVQFTCTVLSIQISALILFVFRKSIANQHFEQRNSNFC